MVIPQDIDGVSFLAFLFSGPSIQDSAAVYKLWAAVRNNFIKRRVNAKPKKNRKEDSK